METQNSTNGNERLVDGYTMNGVPFAEAEQMVLAFLDHRNSAPAAATSIWFPSAFVTQILASKANDKIDGVRFYFAKDQLRNTVVPVATKEGPNMSKRHQRPVHIDFFFPQQNNYYNAHPDYSGKGLYMMSCGGKNCNETVSSIKCEDAVKWAKDFQNDHNTANKEEIINTTSVWYDISFFERLDHKLAIATKLGPETPDGIRLYFVRNQFHRDGFVFFTTYKNKAGESIDDLNCYDINREFYVKRLIVGGMPDDRGEECPIFCPGTTWSDCELP